MPEDTFLNPLAILGDHDLIFGFKGLGFETYALKGPAELENILREIIEKKFAICLVQENIFELGKEKFELYRHSALPVFIPFGKGATSQVLHNMIGAIKLRATGVIER